MSSQSTKPVFRWGLIGPGRIAGRFAYALNVAKGACLQAVVGRSRSKVEKFTRDHSAPVSYETHRALLADPQIDAVYIATPHRYHHELARDCLLAGKPVLCEKPLTVNASEAQALIELSRSNGVFLMEAMWTRFLPIYDVVNQWLVAGEIGLVTSISSSFGFKLPHDPNDRMLNHELAGGALLDMGVYNLAMSQWVFGEQPVGHSIEGHIGQTGVDEHVETVLTYSRGRCSRFVNSMTTPQNNELIIHGTDGHIRVHPMFWSATRATLVRDRKRNGSPQRVSAERKFRATGLEYEIEAAQHCIRNGVIECPTMPHADTLDTMNLMDRLRCDMGLSYNFESRHDHQQTHSVRQNQ